MILRILTRGLIGLLLLALACAAVIVYDAHLQRPARFAVKPRHPTVVVDHTLGLAWQRCPFGTTLSRETNPALCEGKIEWMSHDTAAAVVQHRNVAGQTWRLPTVRELNSLVDESRCCHALDPAFPTFGIPPVEADKVQHRRFPFHTSTRRSTDSWRVDSITGEVHVGQPKSMGVLRLVREATAEELKL